MIFEAAKNHNITEQEKNHMNLIDSICNNLVRYQQLNYQLDQV
jgi:hypothetical protein